MKMKPNLKTFACGRKLSDEKYQVFNLKRTLFMTISFLNYLDNISGNYGN
jgi:hypothetical protein